MTGKRDPAPAGDRAERPRTILVVEDEILIRTAVALHLRDAGYRVVEAANADEALRALAADGTIDLVFSDVNMPGGMDGNELARILRRDRPAMKVVLASGAGWPAGSAIEGVPRLAKPYAFAELPRLIGALLDEAASQ